MPPPHAIVAAGHAATYALHLAAHCPGVVDRLVLIAPTWRGPLPTMMGSVRPWFSQVRAAIDHPILGPLLYRLNVSRLVVRKMAHEHVYSDLGWLSAERLAEKLAVTRAPGARHGSVRFVTGTLDRVASRAAFLDLARRANVPTLVVYGAQTPSRSRAEIEAMGPIPNIELQLLLRGKLSVHEEFPIPLQPSSTRSWSTQPTEEPSQPNAHAESRKRANEIPRSVGLESARNKARAALRAVSQGTGFPVDAILGRQRLSAIVAARHEAGWRVHEVTKWSLPRVEQFFAGRDHTTVLHSVRHMEDRAARDPKLRAYCQHQAGLPNVAAFRRPLNLGSLAPGIFSRVASAAAARPFRLARPRSHSRRSVGGRWASNPSTWAKFLVRAAAAEPSREKRRRGGWLPLAPAAPPRVRRRLPRVPRALAARPPRGWRAGQGRRQAQRQ